VTFEFNGTQTASIINSKIMNPIVFKSKNPSIYAAILTMKGLGLLPESLNVEVPSGQLINAPIKRGIMPSPRNF
jgi:hypothetical protein